MTKLELPQGGGSYVRKSPTKLERVGGTDPVEPLATKTGKSTGSDKPQKTEQRVADELRAKELNITFAPNIGDAKLAARIAEAEVEIDQQVEENS